MRNEKQKKNRWWLWLFPVTGLFALIWFLVRVVPKPSRAAYPCQRVAAPLAGGFLYWLAGLVGSIFAFRKAKHFFKRSRIGWAAICLIVLVTAGVVTVVNMPEEPVIAATSPNSPIGEAKGIHPGRVVWAWDPDATDWDGFDSPEHWWESDHTDLSVVEKMVSQVIRGVVGKSTDTAAWDVIFKYNNQTRGKGNVGYTAGEKIAIKLNLTTCNARNSQVDPTTYDKNPEVMNRTDNSPQMVLVLLRHLVNTVGVSQEDITVGDPTGMVPNYYWDMLTPEFPNVKYWDNYGGSGRTRAEFSTVPFYWSTTEADGKLPDYLPQAVVDADYIINFAVLKGHSAGVSLCAKNHYGTLIRCPDGYLRDSGKVDFYDTHLTLPNAVFTPGTGHYRSLVDLMGHEDILDKTMLYLLDGLFSGYYWESVPVKWTSAPFGDGVNGDWPSSLLGSQDPVAIDSVGYDFLLAEWPGVVHNGGGDSLQGGAEDYLLEASQANNPPSGTLYDPENDGTGMASLGVLEHWNNAADKQYSRNLGTGEGIELFRISNPGGSTAELALNREKLNFAYVIDGDTPGTQTFNITKTGNGTTGWIVEEETSWLGCTPTSGNDSGQVTVSVDPGGMSAGTYIGSITVTDLNAADSSQFITVTLTVFAAGSDSAPFGQFATPGDGAAVSSSIAVTGWVLDDVQVESVKIYRDGQGGPVYIGDALLVEGARPDVETSYPTYPMNYKAGWGYMMLTNFLPDGGNGTFKIHAVARDSSGHETTLGTKTITCDNADAVKPFGAIDTPTQGGEASGAAFRNHGWVLTPMPNSVPTDGSTIEVYVDGVYLGHPVYDVYREDVATLFPGYSNSDGAHAYFDFDTTGYAAGVHTIYWVAGDSAGNTDGIGSRYFTIQNSNGTERARRAAYKEAQGTDRETLKPGPLPNSGAIGFTKGYKRDAKLRTMFPDRNGNIAIELNPLERLELRLTPGTGHWTLKKGYQLVGNQVRKLPIGSTLDKERGIFYWHAGAGFLGEFRFVFDFEGETGTVVRRNITVKIR